MQARLFLFFAISLLLTTPTFAGGFLPGNPPDLSATAVRNGSTVTISGTVQDENVNTVSISLEIGGAPFTTTFEVINGSFSFDLKIPLFIDEVTVIAIDEEQKTDSVTLDI